MSNETNSTKPSSEAKPSTRMPLYKQIKQYVLNNIRQSVWQSNDKIPSENELAAKFKVSRITIKNALQELIEEGLIYRIQGKGSFVSKNGLGEPPVYRPEQRLTDNRVAYLMPRLDNRFTANLLHGIENQLAEEGCDLLFRTTGDSQETEKQLLNKLVHAGVKGVIIYPAQGQSYNEEILKLTLNEFPVVVVDRYLRGVETNYVCSDNIGGAFDATTHCIQLGHRSIGFISTFTDGTSSLEDRLAGYEKALSEHGILIDRHLRLIDLDGKQVNSILQEGTGHPASKEQIVTYLERNPGLSAVIAVNSSVGLTFMEAAKQLSIRVPENISVVFLDDFELSAFSAIPPTYVNQEEYTVGREAVKLLVSVMENPRQKRRKIVVPTRLVVRESSASWIAKDAPHH
ncbi:GntR family transcriptional regulator [Paenibacillus hemerocallicola]|uniref:GntR family transcriptional regulator n=1 Tax=Paenibacillus hemerocallicola TaxID=1172614 RepID=A0A5C4T733_9BACL|nr:GntR family transcriptional regulator [Paenibacillus hemerocallicola]TNJ64848.1 GntR family transcriptional regulator [Paenibacillus hemerocallicola]